MSAARPDPGPATADELRQWLQNRAGTRVVLATGCFDLLHAGHLCFLQQASRLGDLLIVGVNSDLSVRALKGPARPIVAEQERALLVGALRYVDRVFLFDETSADTQIRDLRPDVFVIGPESVAAYPGELQAAHEIGAHIHVTDRVAPHSTSSILESLQANQ